MGGRGAVSGISKASPIIGKEERIIETTYYSSRWGTSPYKDTVLEATADNNGNLMLTYAVGEHSAPSAKTNKTHNVTYRLKAGVVNGRSFGIDWTRVKSVSGQTFAVKNEAKEAGLVWDSVTKKWIRK